MLLQIPVANWFGTGIRTESHFLEIRPRTEFKDSTKQDQEEAGFLNQRVNSLFKSVTAMYSTLLLQHKQRG